MKKIDDINFDDWDDEIVNSVLTEKIRYVNVLKKGDNIILNGKHGIVEKTRNSKDIIYFNIEGKIHEYVGYNIFCDDNIILEKII